MAAWTVDSAYTLGYQEGVLYSYMATGVAFTPEQQALFDQVTAQRQDFDLFRIALYHDNNLSLYNALGASEERGMADGWNQPITSLKPSPSPPEDLCPILQSDLQNATDAYLAKKTAYDQATQNKSVAQLQTYHDAVTRLSNDLEHLNTQSDLQLTSDLASVTGDTLNLVGTMAGYLPPVFSQTYSKFALVRDGTFLAVDATEGKIDLNTVFDSGQLVASVVGRTLTGEQGELYRQIADIGSVLLDTGQIPSRLGEITAKADVVAKQLHATQDKLDDVLFFQKLRPQIEKSLNDDYNAINQKIAAVYGKCVTQLDFQNGEIITPVKQPSIDPTGRPIIVTPDASPATTQPAINSLGMIELPDPRVGTLVYGTVSNDTITKTIGDNGVFAGDGNDLVTLGGSNNVVFGGRGNDTIKFGSGLTNVVGFDGKFADYKMAFIQGNLVVTDTVANRDGVDTLTGATHLQFLDGEYSVDFSVPDVTKAIRKMDVPDVVAQSPIVIDPTKLTIFADSASRTIEDQAAR